MKRLFKTALTIFATVAFTSVALAGGSMGTKCTHNDGVGIRKATAAVIQVKSKSKGSAVTLEGVQ